MSVLQAGKVLGGEKSEEEEELGDKAMMALDQSLTSLLAEQKLWIQAWQDEKSKPQKEKALQCDFQIWVLDLVEVLVTKQPENVLVLKLLEPLLGIIRCSLHSSSSKQEQDLLHKTACIFTHHLCHGHRYCHDLGDHVEALHGQVARLMEQAGHQPDSTALYHFNASLYLLQVLKGSTAEGCMHETQEELEAVTNPSPMTEGSQAAGCLDLNLTMHVYSSALSSFLTKRHSPLMVPMFFSLFFRHLVSVRAHPAHLGSPLSPSATHTSQHSLPHQVLCKSLLPILV
ncbi:Myb-binding protein 1A [Saguinus oedipus]|uniref:Myb-binding protein 1A n=1 Tax=Saguinus oedipus TaxID=9490 RepID=A0ABQ9UM76_SAGOE|nr:Myb-binding protein 1A [Saguinus oedipus]